MWLSPLMRAFQRGELGPGSAARPEVGYRPQSQPETGESPPTPPSGESVVQPASVTISEGPCKLKITKAFDTSHVACQTCGQNWLTTDRDRPGCPALKKDLEGTIAVRPDPNAGRDYSHVKAATARGGHSPLKTPLEGASLEALFGEVLRRIDPDASREGLAETPARAAKAWQYWCSGYGEDVDALFKSFEDGAEGYDEMVVVHGIPVLSHCEHHLASISGIAHVGYIPDGRVVGLSKLARVVDALSRRLQVQERLTVQIADAIERNLRPRGVAVIVRAEHACMSSRGVRIHGSTTTTSALRGCLHEGPARSEFIALCNAAERKGHGQERSPDRTGTEAGTRDPAEQHQARQEAVKKPNPKPMGQAKPKPTRSKPMGKK